MSARFVAGGFSSSTEQPDSSSSTATSVWLPGRRGDRHQVGLLVERARAIEPYAVVA